MKQTLLAKSIYACLGMALVLPHYAVAQQTNESTNDTEQSQTETEDSSGLETILVTARKREESLQDTPISITAFSEQSLNQRQITNVGGIADFTPNLTINTSASFSGSASTPAVFIRGVGQVDFTLNTDPGVGLYVNGVYVSRAVGGLIDLLDIAQIEVLRGPQGTLFGRNTIGGAINVTTALPEDYVSGKARVIVGSDNRAQFSGTINLPISDDISSRWSINYHNRDGYVSRPDGTELGNDDSLSVRGTFKYEPSDDLQVILTADYTREDEESAPFVMTAINADAPFAAFHNAVVAPILDPSLAFPLGPMGPPSACLLPDTVNVACYNEASVSVGIEGRNDGSEESASEIDVFGFSLTAEYALSDYISLKSITAYRDLESFSTNEGDSSPVRINFTTDVFTYDQFSQEFQLLGSNEAENLNWILGAFYFTEEGNNANVVEFSVVEFLSGGEVENESIAAFGQATYSITDKIDITAGIRWTEDTRDFTPDTFITNDIALSGVGALNGARILPFVTATTTASDVTPLLNVSYTPSENITLFATYSEGFKSGGFTQRVFPPIVPAPGQDPAEVIPSFEPETVKTVELGFKSQLFNKNARLNASIFSSSYEDQQINVQEGIAPTTQNAGESTIDGFEVEFVGLLTDSFKANVGVGYLDAQYDFLGPTVNPVITLDSALPGVSEWTINAGANYEFDLNDNGYLSIRLDASYRSEFFFDAPNEIAADSYTVVNLSLNWEDINGDWKVSLFGTNLTDETYALAGTSILNPAGFSQTIYARGAEWGLSLTRSF